MSLLDISRTAVAFQPGTYGNYLKWILYTLLVDGPIISPFRESTSHNKQYLDSTLVAKGYVKRTHDTLDSLEQNSNIRLTILHPVMDGQDPDTNFINGVDKISCLMDRVLISYFDYSTYLLGVHNYLYKMVDDIWAGPLRYVNRQNLADGWGVETSQDLNNVPRWILREHHSLNIFNSWENQCSWFAPTQISNPNCKFVFISDLFYNFLPTIEKIRQFLDTKWIRDPLELVPYHKINIANQQYKNQDAIATQILHSVADGVDFTWNANSITLYTEAYIQRALRHQGIMLKCNKLNDFPTSTKELIETFE